MSTDGFTFKCECGSADFVIPDNDDGMVICNGCKREIGTLKVVREAMIEAGKKEIDQMSEKRFGVKPEWK